MEQLAGFGTINTLD